MLKIIAATVASCAVLAGLALAIDEQTRGRSVAHGHASADGHRNANAGTIRHGLANCSSDFDGCGGYGLADRTAAPATVTPAAVPGTGGEPGGSSNLLLILALGAGVVAGTAGLAGFAVTRRS